MKHDDTDDSKRRPPAPGMSRRGALRRIGLLGAGATAGAALTQAGCRGPGWSPPSDDPFSRPVSKPYVPGAEAWSTFEERHLATSCAQCPAGCGITVRVVEGRAVGITGNPRNPLNRGGVGPRGLSSLQVLYDADRLTGPMVRAGGHLVSIGWEEALALLAERLDALRRRGAPEELLVMSGLERGFMNELLERMCRAFGTPNFIDGRPSRTATLAQATAATLGVDTDEIPAYDWAGAGAVLSLEAGLFEDSCQSVYLARVAGEERRGPGARAHLIHAGASFDLPAHNADRWLPIRPGTGGALALGVAQVLIAEKLYDADVIRERTDGFDAFARLAARFTPERTAVITGIEARAISEIAHTLSQRRPAFALVDERSLAFSNGFDTARAALGLSALLGAFSVSEGGIRLAPRPPYRDWPALAPDEVAARGLAHPRLDRAGTAAFARARSVLETVPDAILDAHGHPAVSVALLYHANPVYARQQPARWRRALEAVPFVVSFSPFRDETASEVAHLVLPDHTFLERWEDAAAAPALPRAVVGLRRPVVEPLHQTRATGDVILDVARRLGGPLVAALPWQSFREALEARLMGLADAGSGNFVESDPRRFMDLLIQEGVWYEAKVVAPPQVRVALPGEWSEPTWAGDAARFPLKLVPYRPLGYAEGTGANLPWLRVLRGRPRQSGWHPMATMHPESAPGVADGDRVRISSPWGALSIPVRLDERMPVGHVAVPMGGGHTAMGRWARGVGVNPMILLAPGSQPVTGANLLCATRVRVEKEA